MFLETMISIENNMNKIKYPQSEIVWQSYYNVSGELQFIITSKHIRDTYYLYELKNNKFVKLGKAKTPIKLEETYDIKNRINSHV